MILKVKNFVTLSLMMLLLLGCDALPFNRPLPTLVPTIAITYVATPAGPADAPTSAPDVPAVETPLPSATPEFEDALEPSPTIDVLPTEFIPTQPAPADGYPAPGGGGSGGDGAYPAPDSNSALSGNPAAQAAAGEPTQTPVAVIRVGFEDTPVPDDAGDPGAAPTSEPGEPAQPGGSETEEWATFYLIAVGDNGASGQPAGCGDSLVEMSLPLETPTNDPLRTSLETLLAQKDQYVGDLELYNPLWQSNLTLDSASIGGDGTAQIVLSGDLNMVESCDGQRVKDMLQATAMRVPGVQSTSITLNDLSIDEALPSP